MQDSHVWLDAVPELEWMTILVLKDFFGDVSHELRYRILDKPKL